MTVKLQTCDSFSELHQSHVYFKLRWFIGRLVELRVERLVERWAELRIEWLVELRVRTLVEQLVELRVERLVDRWVELRIELLAKKFVEPTVELLFKLGVKRLIELRHFTGHSGHALLYKAAALYFSKRLLLITWPHFTPTVAALYS